jgi:hypothetical protein
MPLRQGSRIEATSSDRVRRQEAKNDLATKTINGCQMLGLSKRRRARHESNKREIDIRSCLPRTDHRGLPASRFLSRETADCASVIVEVVFKSMGKV